MQQWLRVKFLARFGAARRPKLHKLIAHLYDEFLLGGNFQDGDAGLNEALHKAIKSFWIRTNKRQGETELELIMAEHVATSVFRYLDSKAHLQDDLEVEDGVNAENEMEQGTCPGDGGGDECEALPAGGAVGSRAQRKSQYGRPTTPVRLEADLGFSGLAGTLRVHASTAVLYRQSFPLRYVPVRFDGRRHIARAAVDFYCSAPYSWVLYRDPAGYEQYSRCRAVRGDVGDEARDVVVLELTLLATPAAECPFTPYGCKRLQWVTELGCEGPVLEADQFREIKVVCVEQDWNDFVIRHGLKVMPIEVPTNPTKVRIRRFFTNSFVRE